MEEVNSTITPRVNLRGMIQLDQIEDLLSSLLHRINKQDQTIENLQKLCKSFMPQNKAMESISEIEKEIKKINLKLDITTKASTSILGEKEISAGDLSRLNSIHIQQINNSLLTLAKRDEIDNHFKLLTEQYNKEFKEIREITTPIEATNELSLLQQELSIRLTGFETILASKFDRSEIRHIEILAAKLAKTDNFQLDTKLSLEELFKQTNKLDNELIEQSKKFPLIKEDFSNINNDIKNKISKVDTQIRSIAREIELQSKQFQPLATKHSVNQLQELLNDTNLKLSKTNAHCTELEDNLTNNIIPQFPTKANISDVRQCVLRTHYDQAVETLGSAIDEKVPSTDLEIANKRIEILESKLESESIRLSIAMRFVDWFTSRGENYEHNMKVIDKHLNNLATSSSPSERSPYEGQVRFTSVMESMNKI